MNCEDCKFVLIHYDKKDVKTIRCYRKYILGLEKDLTKLEKPSIVDNPEKGCKNFEQDSYDISHRTYHAKKDKDKEG